MHSESVKELDQLIDRLMRRETLSPADWEQYRHLTSLWNEEDQRKQRRRQLSSHL